MFLVSSTNASDTDDEYGSKLAPYEVAIMVNEPTLHAVMAITDNTTPKVKQFWSYGILEELNYK
jgi:hypothetical protein